MTNYGPRLADRLEEYIAAVDVYEPRLLDSQEDLFRIFARFLARSLDGRYLDRHPPTELIPAIETLMATANCRKPDEAKIDIELDDEEDTAHMGVLRLCTEDRPFLVSVVRQALEKFEVRAIRSFENIMPIRRNVTHNIEAIGTTDGIHESIIWIEIETDRSKEQLTSLKDYLNTRINDLRLTGTDFHAMEKAIEQCASMFDQAAEKDSDNATALQDNARFIRWLAAGHFVFLGMRYLSSGTKEKAYENLGIGRSPEAEPDESDAAETKHLLESPTSPFLWIRKSKSESWVYRPGQLDRVLLQCYDDSFAPCGLLVVEGCFSFQAVSEPRMRIPLLDRVFERLMESLEAVPGTHKYRSVRNAFNALPLEYLLLLGLEDIKVLVEQSIDVSAASGVQVHISTDAAQRFAFVFAVLPRSYYTNELQSQIRKNLKSRFEARSADAGNYASNGETVALHFFLTGTKAIAEETEREIKEYIGQLAQPWQVRLKEELDKRFSSSQARQLHSLYSNAFPRRYREETSVKQAVTDIGLLESLNRDNQFNCEIYRERGDARQKITRLRLFDNQNVLLSDILPILDNLGLIVIDQYPTRIQIGQRAEEIISTFRIRGVSNMDFDLLSRRNRLSAAIRALMMGAMDNDPLNRLLLRADIPWTYVALIRAYYLYARQTGSPFTLAGVRDALEQNSETLRALTEFFRTKFDPTIEGLSASEVDEHRLELVDRSRRALLSLLDCIEDLSSDQILRTLYNLVEATTRTNFYQRAPYRDFRLVLKLDPSKINRIPEPRPYREIYVHHPKVDGLHLRGGPVARGGIRWSDRLLDFRTEVLGLMATQNLKNVVIVPRGAKGAFVVRQTSTESDKQQDAAREAYKIFVRGLLDVTDNLVADTIVPPENVLRYDADDNYLVVAADKGTARFSDTANELAETYNFWMGDGFASGGSKGYDHKVDGITAKGAWESVRRHFREMAINPESDPISAVGIGDMSGDVFGNGMLRSQSLKLIAAFDHRHIFIDPNPDPAASYKARLHLFETPPNCWEDYPTDLISQGGGVYPRGAKTVQLSPEAKKSLGIDADELSGPDLVKAILSAPVDLLWNGGIGTYIRADPETDLDAGDPANDAVRIAASSVRCRVIGEGGNLGITARGRVQLGIQHVRLNTDAIDNAGGVDLSDHEVNIKLLLQRPLARNEITSDERDALLEEVRAEVNRAVLNNNWVQCRMLSLDEIRSKRDLPRFQRALDYLAREVPFNRKQLNLPNPTNLGERTASNVGFHRPELAALASNAKLFLRQQLASSEFTLEELQPYLLDYFPSSLVERFKPDVLNHPLALEIAHTAVGNAVLGDAGCTLFSEIAIQSGQSAQKILRAYLRASALLGAHEVKATITELETELTATNEYLVRLLLEDAIEDVACWLLRHPQNISVEFEEIFQTVLSQLAQLLPADESDSLRNEISDFGSAGITEAVSARLGCLRHIDDALCVTQIAVRCNTTPDIAAAAYFLVGSSTNLTGVINSCATTGNQLELERPARFAIQDQIRMQIVELSAILLGRESDMQAPSDTTLDWLESIHRDVEPIASGSPDLSQLIIVTDRVGQHLH